MKAVSEVLTSVILTTAILIISITIAFIATANIQSSLAATEYGYGKSMLMQLADSYPGILRGAVFTARYPTKTGGLSYRRYDLGLKVIVYYMDRWDNVYNYTKTYTGLEALVYYGSLVLTYRDKISFYGSNTTIVNDTVLLAHVHQEYDEKYRRPIIVFDTWRVYVANYTGDGEAVVYIAYPQLSINPVFASNTLKVYLGDKTRETVEANDIVEAWIIALLYNTTSNEILSSSSLTLYSSTTPVDLTIIYDTYTVVAVI